MEVDIVGVGLLADARDRHPLRGCILHQRFPGARNFLLSPSGKLARMRVLHEGGSKALSASVLLLGAGGQLGRLVRDAAAEPLRLQAFGSAELDITDVEQLRRACEAYQPDLIINTAAYTAVDQAESDQARAFAVNAQGPANLAAVAPPETRLVHVSTDFVFDGRSRRPYRPDDETAPLGVYGQSKLEGEQALLAARPDSTVLRTAWLYAAEGGNFLNTMLRLMATRDELRVVADQTGAPTSAHTLAEVIWRLALADAAGGVYHWTDGGSCSWYDFAMAIQEEALALGLLTDAIPVHPISSEDYPTPAQRPAYSVLDRSRTIDATGFRGRFWREELVRVLEMKAEKRIPERNPL